ncbi:hypothetical protein [Streptomyces sp. NBC_00989]|uniref:hypothetical protein n=1 Tax=Streptomyces sp. NBC_00989 TaxID=2903705 RepID=UPI00386EB466|nr:hypothetical protein OG714_28045 [Streptomyces sp. NBC_00989]
MTEQQRQGWRHAEEPEPPRIRETLSEIGRDVRTIYYPQSKEALRELWADFRKGVAAWPQGRLRELWLLGELRAMELGRLTDLDEATRDRTAPHVAAAARSQEMRSSWSRALSRLSFDFPALHFGLVVLYTITIGLGIFRWVGDGAPAAFLGTLFTVTAVLFCICLIVVRFVTFLFGFLFGPAANLLTKLLLSVGCAGLGRSPDWWQDPLDRWKQQPDIASWERNGTSVADFKLDGSIVNALGILAALYGCVVLYRLIITAAQVFGPREPRRDLACAVMLDRFLDIALALQPPADNSQELAEQQEPPSSRAPGTADDEEDETDDDSTFTDAGTGLRPYIASAERRLLVRELEELAEFVEGRWRRAIRTDDHTGDVEANRVADGIAARIRHWKPVAAMGGPELEDMRKAFTVAVVNIADEDWRIMAADVSSRDLLSRRLIRWTRRLAATIVLLGTWAVLTTKPFAWVTTADETGMAPVLYVLAIAVATTLDPAAHDRVIGAIRQAGELKSKAG